MIAKLRDALKKYVDTNDLMALVGMLMLGYGLWLVYPAAAPIVLGVLLIKLAIWGK